MTPATSTPSASMRASSAWTGTPPLASGFFGAMNFPRCSVLVRSATIPCRVDMRRDFGKISAVTGRLENKVIIVAGLGGIGNGLARRYADEGASLVIGDLDAELGS